MRKINLILALVLLSAGFSTVAAQQTAAYSGMFNVGMLYGSNKSKIQVQTIQGVTYRGWFAGVGGGIDDYFKQSVPIFIDVRKNILNQSSSPFLYAEGGVNLVTKGAKDEWKKVEMKSGSFYEFGAGYKIGLNQKLSLNFAAGYSVKDYQEKTYAKKYLPTPPYKTDDWILSNKDDYHLQRFVMKVGLQF